MRPFLQGDFPCVANIIQDLTERQRAWLPLGMRSISACFVAHNDQAVLSRLGAKTIERFYYFYYEERNCNAKEKKTNR